MKAVILSGGLGTRLRPLTNQLPKPLIPIMGKPVIEYILDLLKKSDIDEIFITLQYQAEAFMDILGDGSKLGINLKYIIEDQPLGTAGCIKNIEQYLNDTFVVISGDILTDIDLAKVIDFHKNNNSCLTMPLVKVNDPTQYGIVSADEQGKITCFKEKPKASEVFTNIINTGIYVCNPEVLTLFGKNLKFDFSKDLFPLMMQKKIPIYGMVTDRYWCDIGNINSYLKVHCDLLDGKLNLNLNSPEMLPRVYTGNNCSISHSAKISGPVFIGNDSIIDEDVVIQPYTIIGDCSVIHQCVHISNSVLWNQCDIGEYSNIEKCVLCNNVSLKHNISIFDMALQSSGKGVAI
ncbi:MAG: NDP-sugar synthase [Bacillota bacterium]|nr:NDP-sugar synthase [Bacillota bacterium]